VTTAIREMRLRSPDRPIQVLTRTPAFDGPILERLGVQVLDHPAGMGGPKRVSRVGRLLGRSAPPPSPEWKPVLEAISGAALVVASGGDIFSSDYGGPMRQLRPLRAALDAGVPVVFLAQSVGPFRLPKEAAAWTSIARRSALVTVRERISYDYVTGELGLPARLIELTADPAFLLPAAASDDAEVPMEVDGRDRPIVTVAVSGGISRFGGVDGQRHLAALIEVVRTALDTIGARVVLVAHVQDDAERNDDRVPARALYEHFDRDPRITLAGDVGAAELKALIAGSDMLVAERMHAAIAGLSSGICTVAVGYSIKARGIMRAVLGDDVADQMIVSVERFIEPGVGQGIVREAWRVRSEVEERLRQRLPGVRRLAGLNFDLIEGLLDH
jgi:colanic acid/amylovoran biosynthesis protein